MEKFVFGIQRVKQDLSLHRTGYPKQLVLCHEGVLIGVVLGDTGDPGNGLGQRGAPGTKGLPGPTGEHLFKSLTNLEKGKTQHCL